jgi:hypothetical protein
MSVFALLSAGGSPGVTTSALALTLSWPSQVILAECDPSGGDVLAGLLRGHLSASSGLLPLALEAGAGAEIPADTLWRQLIELDEEHNRLLLAGISDPRQSAALQSSLPWIAEALQGIQADVIADCGRLDAVAAVRPVLAAASLAVLVLRPSLRQVSRAMPRIEMLTNLVGRDRVVILLVGEGTAPGHEVARTLGLSVAGQLPDDPRTAAVLSDGSGRRHRMEARPLIRAATVAGRRLREAAEAAGPLLGYASQVVYSDPGPARSGIVHSGAAQPGQVEPRFDQPSFDQPSFDQPSFDRPGFDQPRFGQAGIGQPGFGQSGFGDSRFGQSGSTGPNHHAPDPPGISPPGISPAAFSRPDFRRPDLSRPDFSGPELSPPDLSRPELSPPDLSSPDLSSLGLGEPGLGEPAIGPRGRHSMRPPGPNPSGHNPPAPHRRGLDQPSLDQPGHDQPGREENGHGEPALARFRLGRFTLGQPDAAAPGSGQPGSGQPGSGQHGSGQHGNGQHSNGQHGNGQHSNGQHGTTQNGSRP